MSKGCVRFNYACDVIILICCPRNWSGVTAFTVNIHPVNKEVPHAVRTNSRPATIFIALSLKNTSANLIAGIIFVSVTCFLSPVRHVLPMAVYRLSCFAEVDNWGPFYWHGINLIPAWIRNHIHCKIWDEFIYAFPTLQRCSLGIDKWLYTTLYRAQD